MVIGIDIRLIGKKQTGSEAVFFNLAKNFVELDKKNKYFLYTDATDKKELGKIKANLGIQNQKNFKLISIKTKNKFSWNFWTIQRYLRKNPVDIYLTQYITPFFVPRKIKVATIMHDISFNFFPQFIKKSDLFFLKTLIPISLRRADIIISVSKFTQDEIKKYYKTDSQKMFWIHNAVNAEFVQKAAKITLEEISSVREKYKLPKNYILYIGTLQPRKNLPVLIEAYAKIKNEIGSAKIVIAGGKGHNYDKRVDEAVVKYGLEKDIIFPGFIDEEDKVALLAGAKIFCWPSLYEGFGIPILEAMAAKTPVVASNIAPHLEIGDGAAVFFNPNNSSNLAQKLASLIHDHNFQEELKEKGLVNIKNFSWKRTAKKVLEIFASFDKHHKNSKM